MQPRQPRACSATSGRIIPMLPAIPPATRPTLYFIGVTTRQSSINAVFPRWAERLGLGDCELRGLDFPLGAPPERYRAAIEAIRRDPLARGALVTTHKVAVYRAARELFDAVDPLTEALGEFGSIYKRGDRLHGRAVDPVTSGLALTAFWAPARGRETVEALVLGAGGAGTALAWRLSVSEAAGRRPRRVVVADRSAERIEHLRRLHAAWPGAAPLEARVVAAAREADALVAALAPGSLVVNATGAGKDTPGSPLTGAAQFPEGGAAWEFNYRGDLVFLAQARAQAAARRLHVEDGWTYFLHGWSRVIADVFDRDIPTSGPVFDDLGRIAAATR